MLVVVDSADVVVAISIEVVVEEVLIDVVVVVSSVVVVEEVLIVVVVVVGAGGTYS